MYDFPIKRTPEQGHSPACWTKTMITALENERDALLAQEASGEYWRSAEHDFRIWLQDNGPLALAEHLLATGSAECICPPLPSDVCDHDPNGWECSRYIGCPAY